MTPEQRRDLGRAIAAERNAAGLTQIEVAQRVLDALPGTQKPELDTVLGYVKRWEAGRAGISSRNRQALAQALNVDAGELFGISGSRAEETDEERRRLLASLSVLGVDTALSQEPLEPIRQALARALPGGMPGHLVGDWEEVAYEHGHAFLTTPPKALLPALAHDLVRLQRAIRAADAERTRQSLCGPAGKMAALIAMTVATLGDARQARDWWKTARHTADASHDRDLRIWVRGYEAMSALYSRRPVPMVLRLADEAVGIAGESTTGAVMEALASRAQALAILGRHAEAETAIEAIKYRFERLPQRPPDERLSTGAWPETALHHTAAFTYTYTRNAAAAERAQAAALAVYPQAMQRQRAQIELLHARCLIQAGDVATGVEHASQTVAALRPEQRTTTIRLGTEMVLDAIPGDDRAIGEYRRVLDLPGTAGGTGV